MSVETSRGEIQVYGVLGGGVRIDLRLDHDMAWLQQGQMSDIFGRERRVITKRVQDVFRGNELNPGATCAKFAQVQEEGRRPVELDGDDYNLDVIISVGYRGKSVRRIRRSIPMAPISFITSSRIVPSPMA